MTLSVTGATGALAALQALSLTTSSDAKVAESRADAPPAPASEAPAVSKTSATLPSLFAAVDGMGQALSAADAAGAAGGAVLDLLQQMRDAAGQASDPTVADATRASLQHAFRAAAGSLAPTLAGATVNGTNLLDGSMKRGLKAPLGDGATASLTPLDLTLGGPTIDVPPDASIATAEDAASLSDTLGQAIGAAGQALSGLQNQADRLRAHGGALQALGATLASPADDGGDSIRLMALQVSQSLSASQGAIANAAPQAILSLFRS